MIGSHKNSISKNRISRIRLIATDVDGTLLGDGGHDLDPGCRYDGLRNGEDMGRERRGQCHLPFHP